MEKRKSQRTFDLQKGGHRSFDLDKKPTRAFELNKEQAAPVVIFSDADSAPQGENRPKSGNKALRNGIIFLIVLVVAICCWLLIPKGSNEADPVPDEPTPVVNDEYSEPTADAEQGTPDEPEAIAEPEVTANAEPDTPADTPKPTANPIVTPVTTSVSNDIEAEARKVVDGMYGNNPERRKLLGDKYEAIQARVNEMKRQGLF